MADPDSRCPSAEESLSTSMHPVAVLLSSRANEPSNPRPPYGWKEKVSVGRKFSSMTVLCSKEHIGRKRMDDERAVRARESGHAMRARALYSWRERKRERSSFVEAPETGVNCQPLGRASPDIVVLQRLNSRTSRPVWSYANNRTTIWIYPFANNRTQSYLLTLGFRRKENLKLEKI